jgi:hypothetical protein
MERLRVLTISLRQATSATLYAQPDGDSVSRAEALPRLSYGGDKPANGWLRALSARLPHVFVGLFYKIRQAACR